ncbi:hypothetical protein [Saccharopolyspora terrae]|uniref:hypothetical protein n=1 Tax=Saccharopolyspora terrae TaxID=2530384 RepID=UPI001A9F655E|nr:hypothetical protein [Saccharopolyspora terrae]
MKSNAAALLREGLASPRWAGEPIAMGVNTDPYRAQQEELPQSDSGRDRVGQLSLL